MSRSWQTALARAFNGQPLIREISFTGSGSTVLLRKRSGAPDDFIGWPVDDVFAFREAEFDRLNALFRAGNVEVLGKAWEEQEPCRLQTLMS